MRYSEKKENLLMLIEDDAVYDEDDNVDPKYSLVSDRVIDSHRWEIEHLLVFRRDLDYFYVYYLTSATEMQDITPFDDEDDEVEIHRCVKNEQVCVVYSDDRNGFVVEFEEIGM